MVLNLENLVKTSIAFFIISIIVVIVIYAIYFSELRKFIPPDYVSSAMNVLISTAGLFIAILAFISYIKLEGEFRSRKITEENIKKEIKRKELLSLLKNFELFIEQFYKGIVPNALNFDDVEILTNFLDKRLSELDDSILEFIKICGHLKNIEEDVSEYEAQKIKIEDFNNLNEENKIKILLQLSKDDIENIKNNFNIKIEDSYFTSDEILRKINDLRYNIFLIKTFAKKLQNIPSENIPAEDLLNTQLCQEINKLFRNTYYKALILYLMIAKNIFIDQKT